MLHIVVHGTIWVSSLTFTGPLRAGDALLVTPHQPHTLRTSPSATRILPVHVAQTADEASPPDCRILYHIEAEPSVELLTLTFPTTDHSPLDAFLTGSVAVQQLGDRTYGLTRMLTEAIARQDPGDRIICSRLAEALFVASLQLHLSGRSEEVLNVLHDPRLVRAVAALHQDVARQWTVPELARLAGMSESLFRSRLREAVGTPWRTYVQLVRIRRAEQLLTMPGASVAQVAMAVGYQSESSFSRAFLGVVGTRPGQYLADMGRPEA